jgi:hypothetical protein
MHQMRISNIIKLSLDSDAQAKKVGNPNKS